MNAPSAGASDVTFRRSAWSDRGDVFAGAAKAWGSERSTYSGCEISATAIYRGRLIAFDSLQTLSVSAHTAHVPVRPLGMIRPRGYTVGSATTAGTIIMLLYHEDPATRLLRATDVATGQVLSLSPTAMPPFDVVVHFGREYDGKRSVARLWGVRITDAGITASVNDLITECLYQYVADDWTIVQEALSGSFSGNRDDMAVGAPGVFAETMDAIRTEVAGIDEKLALVRKFALDAWIDSAVIRGANPIFGEYLAGGAWNPASFYLNGALVELTSAEVADLESRRIDLERRLQEIQAEILSYRRAGIRPEIRQ